MEAIFAKNQRAEHIPIRLTPTTVMDHVKLYRLMPPHQQRQLIEGTARNMAGVDNTIKHRHNQNYFEADVDYGEQWHFL
jgi:catalase